MTGQDAPAGRDYPTARHSIRRYATAALRLAVTAGLLWFLATTIDIARAGDLIARSPAVLLVAAVAALAATTPINALRWRGLLAPGPPLPPAFVLSKILLVGIFFNQVLPSGIGGDVVRAWRCRSLGIRLDFAVRSILLERASGYFIFVALFAAGLPTLLHAIADGRRQAAVLLLLGVCAAGLAALLAMDKLPALIIRWPLMAWFAAVSVAARRFCADPWRLVPNLILSASSVGLTILAFKLVGDGVGARLGYATWLVAVPPVALVQLAPISLAGWGVREAALVTVLAAFGIAPANALAVSLLIGLCQIAVALPGGLLWLGGWDIVPPAGSTATAGRSLVLTRRPGADPGESG